MNRFGALRTIVGLSLFTLLAVANAATLKFAPGFEQCYRNCGQVQLVGNTIVVTALDGSGKAIKIAVHDIDQNATNVVVSSVPAGPPMAGLSTMNTTGSVYTQQTQSTYTTTTQVVVVTIIYYYNASGQLLDIKMIEHRFPKSTIEK